MIAADSQDSIAASLPGVKLPDGHAVDLEGIRSTYCQATPRLIRSAKT